MGLKRTQDEVCGVTADGESRGLRATNWSTVNPKNVLVQSRNTFYTEDSQFIKKNKKKN